MLTIDQTVAAAAQLALAGVGTFIHESQVEATLTANNAALPVIVFGEATSTQKLVTSKVVSARVTLYFAAATAGVGDNAQARYTTQNQMLTLVNRFLTALDYGDRVAVENFARMPMKSIYEAVLDGIGCAFDLTVEAAPLSFYCYTTRTYQLASGAGALLQENGLPLTLSVF